MEILSAMNDVKQDQETVSGAQPVEVDAASGISSSTDIFHVFALRLVVVEIEVIIIGITKDCTKTAK